MKLLTHNLLLCNRKSCINMGVTNFPLHLKVDKWVDYDDDAAIENTMALMTRLAEKLEWSALKSTVDKVS
jgi:hypothetical protein